MRLSVLAKLDATRYWRQPGAHSIRSAVAKQRRAALAASRIVTCVATSRMTMSPPMLGAKPAARPPVSGAAAVGVVLAAAADGATVEVLEIEYTELALEHRTEVAAEEAIDQKIDSRVERDEDIAELSQMTSPRLETRLCRRVR